MFERLVRFFRPRIHSTSRRTPPSPAPPSTADPKLPDELLLQLFSYLDIDGLVTAGQVCHTWRRIASSLQFTLPLLQPLVPNLIFPKQHDPAILQLLSSQRRVQRNRMMGRYSVAELPINVGNTFKVHFWFTNDNCHAVALAEIDAGFWVFTVVDIGTQKVIFTRNLDSENAGLFDPFTKIYFGEDNNRLIRIDINTLRVTYEPFPAVPHGLYCWRLNFNDAGQLTVEPHHDTSMEKSVYSPDGMVQYHWTTMNKCKPTVLRVTGACNIQHQAESCFGLAVAPDNRHVLISGYTKALLLDFDPRKSESVAEAGVDPGVFVPIKYHCRQWGSCWDS